MIIRLKTPCVGLLAAGFAMSAFVPVSKKLWSPSFMLLVGGYSTAMFAIFYTIIDVRRWRGWVLPLSVVGLNSVTIYILKSFAEYDVVRKWVFGSTVSPGGDVILACAYLSVCWFVTYALWRKKWFLKV